MEKGKSNELYRKHAIRGYRLSRALEKRGLSQAELIRKANDLASRSGTYFDMSTPALNMILKGKRPLHYADAVFFAEILGEDVDYLMGKPGSFEKSLSKAEKDAEKYRNILNQVGSNIVAYSFTDDNDLKTEDVVGYMVSYNTRPYDPEEAAQRLEDALSKADDDSLSIAINSNFDAVYVSVKEMESFYQDICLFIRKRLDILIALNEKEA